MDASKSSSLIIKFSPFNLDWDHEWSPWTSWADFRYFQELKSRLIHSVSLFIVMCVFLLARGLSHVVIVRYGRSRNKIKLSEASALATFPPWTSSDDSFKRHSFRGNWSSSSSLTASDSLCDFPDTCTASGKGCISLFLLKRLHCISLPLTNKKRSWLITLFQRHYRQLIKVWGRS